MDNNLRIAKIDINHELCKYQAAEKIQETHIQMIEHSAGDIYDISCTKNTEQMTLNEDLTMPGILKKHPSLDFSIKSSIKIDGRTLTMKGHTYALNSTASESLMRQGEKFIAQLSYREWDSRLALLYERDKMVFFSLRQSPGSQTVVFKGGDTDLKYLQCIPVTQDHFFVSKEVVMHNPLINAMVKRRVVYVVNNQGLKI